MAGVRMWRFSEDPATRLKLREEPAAATATTTTAASTTTTSTAAAAEADCPHTLLSEQLRALSRIASSAASAPIPIPDTPLSAAPPSASAPTTTTAAAATMAASSAVPIPSIARANAAATAAATATMASAGSYAAMMVPSVPRPVIGGGSPTSFNYLDMLAWGLCEVIERSRSFATQTQTQHSPRMCSPFDGTRAPSYPLVRYVYRIARYAAVSPSCFVLALIYIDRIIASRQRSFVLSELNVHRMLMACLVVATKFWSDFFYGNDYYGRVGGVSSREMGVLEATVLVWLDFRLVLHGDRFLEEYNALQASCTRPLIIPTLMERLQMSPAPEYPAPGIARTPYEHFLRLICVPSTSADDRCKLPPSQQ